MKYIAIYILIGLFIDFIFLFILKLLSSYFNINVWDWFYKLFDTRETTIPILVGLMPIAYIPFFFAGIIITIFLLFFKIIDYLSSPKVIKLFKDFLSKE